jgi:AmmeMemoRadiSam system protein A
MVAGQGFEFLGSRFECGKWFVRRKSLKALQDRIRAKTRHSCGESLPQVIASVNPMLRGWFDYFKHATPGTFKALDGFIRRQLRAILRKQQVIVSRLISRISGFIIYCMKLLWNPGLVWFFLPAVLTAAAAVFPCPGQSESKRVVEGRMTHTKQLSEEEGRELIKLARNTIEMHLMGRDAPAEKEVEASPKFSEKRGTFVTLTIDGALRGCIGHIVPQESIWEGVKENALNAAFRDPRFPPLSREELDRIKVEVSILTEPQPLKYKDSADLLKRLQKDVDGVIIRKGRHQATFLPQVWEQLPNKEAFLEHLCLKAGLSPDAWRHGDLEVLTYQVQAFEE